METKSAVPKQAYSVPSSPSNVARVRFEKLVRRVGCGCRSCSHRLCASCPNGPRLTPDAAAIMAVQLASRPRLFFCHMVPIDPDIDFGDSNNNNNNSNSSYSSNTTTTTTAAAAANSNSSSFYATSPNSSPAGPPTSTTTTSSSKPFLYSLLSSSPFSSLFSSSAQSLNSTSISPSSAAAAVAVATASSSPSRHSNQHYYSNPPSPPSERLDNVRNASLVNSPGLGSPASVAAATAPTTIISTTTRNSTSSGGYGFLGFNMMGFSLGENTDSSQAIISSATVNSSIPPLENNFQTSSGTANANATTNTIPANNNSNNIQNPSSSVSPSIFRTKSLMDLPSLWSASLGFGIVKPRASASGLRTSDSSDSLFENNNSNGDSSLLNTSNNLNQTFASNTSSTTNSSPNDRPLSRLTNSYSASSFSELESSENNGNSQQQQQQGPSSSSSAPPQPPPLQLSLKFINYSLVKRLVCGYESPVASILEIVDLFEDSQPIDTTSIDLTLLSASDFQFLINTLRTVFSSSESLTQSFSCPNSVSGIDLEDVGKSYKLICYLTTNEMVLMTFVNAIEILLAKLELNIKRLQYGEPRLLRQILILFENPLLIDTSYHDSLLKKLCMIVGSLRTKSKLVLKKWLSSYDAKGFTRLIKIFHQYLDAHFYPTPNPDEAVVSAVKVLSLLHHANESSPSGKCIVPLSCFYNETLCRKLSFKEEYKVWKKTHLDGKFGFGGKLKPRSRSSSGAALNTNNNAISMTAVAAAAAKSGNTTTNVTEFSYFNFPFLFDPVAKTRIMHIDAMIQMSQEFEDAFVHQALVIHAQRFLQDSQTVASLEQGLAQQTNPYLVLEVRRSKLVKDVLDHIHRIKDESLLKKPLKIKFVGGGEEGMDQGGVQKEFFQAVVEQLVDPSYGMFTYDEDNRYSWLNGASLESERQFELVGIVIGLALYNGVILGLHFPKLLYKKLLDENIGFEDVKEAFPPLGRGLQQLLDWNDGDVSDIFLRSFEISYEVYGKVKTFPLVDGGSDIPVTNANRKEYVDLYIQHYCNVSIKRQFSAFKRGFYKVCGGKALRMCKAEELELLLVGQQTTEYDFKQLEDGCRYEDFTTESPIIQWFWKIVHQDLSFEQRKKLLTFVTASDRVPLKGLGVLTFVIQRNGPDTDRLPTALTCFGRLLLPDYSSFEKLKDRIINAIENATGFGLL